MGITITMAATIGLASIGISTGDAVTNVTTGSGRSVAGIDMRIDASGGKMAATTMLIDGRGVVAGRAIMIGAASVSMTTGTITIVNTSDGFGTEASACRLSITRPSM